MSPALSIATSRRGFTIVETLIALSVMVVGILALMGAIGNLNQSRTTVDDELRIQALTRSILERLASLPWSDLGGNSTASTAQWSHARFLGMAVSTSDTAYCQPPLTATAAEPENNFIAQQLATQSVPVKNLRIFIEYYRGLDIPATPAPTAPIVAGPGLMDGSAAGLAKYTSSSQFSACFRNSAQRLSTRLASANPTTLIRSGDPLVIRVIAVWDDNGITNDGNGDGYDDDSRYIEFFTARKI